MRKVVKFVGMPAVVAIASLGADAQAADPLSRTPKADIVSASTLQVTQVYGAVDSTRMWLKAGTPLAQAASRECGVPSFPLPPGSYSDQKGVRSLAAPAAIAGGIVVEWLTRQAIKYLSKQATEQVKQHTAGYSNKPVFGDIYAKEKWSDDAGQSCVVAQRWYCTKKVDNLSDCPTGNAQLASTFIFVLRREGGALKAAPLGYDVARFVPRHSKGKLAFSAGLSVQAVGSQNGAGYYWTSKRDGKEAVLIDESCEADGTRKPIGSCSDVYALDWSKAAVLAMPPHLPEGSESSMAALEVNVAEVGRADMLTKAWASFAAASEDSISEAMSSALNKQWKLGEED